MSWVLLYGSLWVLAAAGVAMLPMRHQFVPGITLLLIAPVLIWLIAAQHGLWLGALALFALVSMFRKPLVYYMKKALTRGQEVPK